jgi:hypothetical protein
LARLVVATEEAVKQAIGDKYKEKLLNCLSMISERKNYWRLRVL